MLKTTAYLLRLVAVLVFMLGQQPPATWAAHPADGEEPPDAQHALLRLPPLAPDAGVAGAAGPSTPAATTALAGWTMLAFTSLRDGNAEIYLADGDANYQTRLTNHSASDVQPRLNRGNTRIAFASNRNGNYDIFSMQTNGSSLTQLTQHGEDDLEPAWSPDGTRIAFASNRNSNIDIYVMNADGSGLTRLTTDSDYDAEPAWSPDGTRLTFISRRTGGYRVYAMNADGTGQTQLNNQAYSTRPSWSPDGSHITYSSDSDSNGWYELWWMKANGTEAYALLVGNAAEATEFLVSGWSPNSHDITYTRYDWTLDNGQYYLTNVYPEYLSLGYGSVRWTNTGRDLEPDWQTTDITPPNGHVTMPTAWTTGASVEVSWGATDTGGAGVRAYDVQYREGLGGSWVNWQIDTTDTSATLGGVLGSSYFFRVRTRDNAFNQEAYPSVPDAATFTFAYALTGTVYDNREQPVAVASLSPAPPALIGATTNAQGAYQLHFTQAGPYTVTVTRSGFGNLPGLRNVAADSTAASLYLPPADNRITNSDFETGTLAPWVSSGEVTAVVTSLAHTGLRGIELGTEQPASLLVNPTDTGTPSFVLTWEDGGATFKPRGVALDPTGQFVYATDAIHFTVQKFTSTGTWLLSWGSYGSDSSQFNGPDGIAVDTSGNVYVADSNNGRIQKFTANGVYIAQWGGGGGGSLSYPAGLDFDSDGNLVVMDAGNSRVVKFTPNGIYLSQFGSFGGGNGQFNDAERLAVDAADNIYVADRNNHRVQKFSSGGTFLRAWGTFGSGAHQLAYPLGIAVDSYGIVYVSDTGNHRIVKYDGAGNYISQFGEVGAGDGQFDGPEDLTLDHQNNIYVVDVSNYRMEKFSQPWLPGCQGLALYCGSSMVPAAGWVVAAGPVTLTLPAGGVSTTSTFTITSGSGTPALPAGLRRAGLPFTVTAVISNAVPLTQTEAAITVTLRYSDTAWQQGNIGNESTLQLWQFDADLAAWQPLIGTLDTVNNRVVVTTTRLGLFALLGTEHVGPWVTSLEQPISLGASLGPSTTLSLMYNVAAINAVSDTVRIQLIGPSQTYTYTLSGATLATGAGSWKHAWWAVPAWADASMTVRIELFEADRSTPTTLTFDEISLGATTLGGYFVRLPMVSHGVP